MLYLANIIDVKSFEVLIEFTGLFEPSLISRHNLPFVSLEKEIIANRSSLEAQRLREFYKRIPYSAPLYLWELQDNSNKSNELLYIGQTTLQQIQRRFEGHSTVMKILAEYVNEPTSFVYYRLCSRLDIKYKKEGKYIVRAIEHFPIKQARRFIDDIEAYLVYKCKPRYNTQYKKREKVYWKPFSIIKTVNIDIP